MLSGPPICASRVPHPRNALKTMFVVKINCATFLHPLVCRVYFLCEFGPERITFCSGHGKAYVRPFT
jgi:hypothetical protein